MTVFIKKRYCKNHTGVKVHKNLQENIDRCLGEVEGRINMVR